MARWGYGLKLSIIIANYNYAHFVGQAIDSALAVRWPDVEVIVIDDGSTDESRAIIESYEDRIRAIFQENASQRVACNTAFEKSTGDWVIFLDSDDILDPSIAEEVSAIWSPGISKVQVQMDRIDRDGKPLHSVFPVYDPLPSPEKIKYWAINYTAYPCPPGSGNLYARSFLNKLFPVDDSCGTFVDSVLLTAAPLLGDVVTINKPLVKYRLHGGNDSNPLVSEGLFAREVQRAQQKFHFAQRVGRDVGIDIPDKNFSKSLHTLQHRIASIKLSPALHPIANDTRISVFFDAVKSTFFFDAMSLKRRFALLVWGSLTLFTPLPIAKKLVKLRFRY